MYPFKVKIYKLVITCLLPLVVAGQTTTIDSLRQELSDHPKQNEERFQVLLKLARKFSQSDADSALKYADEAEALAKTFKSREWIARVFELRGILDERSGNLERALSMYEAVWKLGDSLNSPELKKSAHINLGTYHFSRNNLREAIHHGREALKIIDKTNYSEIATVDYNLGISYSYLGMSDSAEVYLKHGIEMAEKAHDLNSLGVNYSGLSVVHYLEGRIPEATAAALKASEYLEKCENLYQQLGALNTLGICYYESRNYPEAINAYVKALRLAKKCSSLDQQSEVYNNLCIAYADMGDFEKAYWYADSTQVIRDSLYNINKEKVAAEMEARFDLERKNQDIKLLNQQGEIKESKLLRQRQFLWGLIVFGALSLVILLILWRNNQLRKRTNRLLEIEKAYEQSRRQQLELKNQKLANENTIAQFQILKNQVDPHFIFNALNILSTLVHQDPKQASEFIRSLSILFRSMLEIKEESVVTLQQELKHTKAYLHLQEVRFGNNLNVEYDIEPSCMSLLIPPFSLQQVVENAIKHNQISSKEPLLIRIRAAGNELCVENTLQPRVNPTQSTKTGITNIRARYQMLGDREPVFREKGNKFLAVLPLLEH